LSQFPSTAGELWPWCLAQTQERLLAFCAAATVDAVVLPHRESSDAAKVEHANQLAAAVQMDMRSWFTPTVENFFGRVSKAQIANALVEAEHPLGPQEVKMKKVSWPRLLRRPFRTPDGCQNRFDSLTRCQGRMESFAFSIQLVVSKTK